MKAFIFDPLWDELLTEDLRRQLKNSDIEVMVTKDISPITQNKELYEGEEPRILCVNPDYVNWKLSVEDYRDIPNLKGIFGAATSFSWIDMTYASENGIPVCNIRNFSTEAVAEWAITMMFSVARQLPRIIKDGFPLDFDKDFMKYRGIELHGKIAAIIGLGNNGSAIAKRCKALGMDVIYWSLSSDNDDYTRVELEDLFKTADVIFPAFAKNNESNKLITDTLLDSMKSTAMIIDIIELDDNKETILNMVEDNKLFGYGFEAKPEKFNDYVGNVWAAPAYAWVTDGSMNNAMDKWVENMVNAAKGNYHNRVNS